MTATVPQHQGQLAESSACPCDSSLSPSKCAPAPWGWPCARSAPRLCPSSAWGRTRLTSTKSMAGMELINLSMWLLILQHREMHPKAVGFVAMVVVDFSLHACSTGGWVVARALGDFAAKRHLPGSQEPQKETLMDEVNQIAFVHQNSGLFHEVCRLSNHCLSMPSCLFVAGKIQWTNFAACAHFLGLGLAGSWNSTLGNNMQIAIPAF